MRAKVPEMPISQRSSGQSLATHEDFANLTFSACCLGMLLVVAVIAQQFPRGAWCIVVAEQCKYVYTGKSGRRVLFAGQYMATMSIKWLLILLLLRDLQLG